MIRVERAVVGGLETNCYLAWNPETMRGFFVDPGSDPDRLTELCREAKVRPEAILLTHGHFDHILAAAELRETFGAKVYCLDLEADVVTDPKYNLSPAYCGRMSVVPDETMTDGEIRDVAGFSVRVIATPGHTKGSASYYLPEEQLVFSGDTLFFETFGNTKLPTGSFASMADSVRNKLLTLPEETRVLPGHDRETTIAHERAVNPLRGITF